MTKKTFTYSRETLYRQIWRRPVSKVAKDYNVSDVALAKICRKLNVPRPPLGYWARRSAGYEDPIPPLPKLKPGERAEYTTVRPRPQPTDTVTAGADERSHAAIVVLDTLENPHELVRRSRGPLRKCARKGTILAEPPEGCLDIRTSSGELDRALRVFDALLKALDARSIAVEITPPHKETDSYWSARSKIIPSLTRALIGDAFVEIGIDEDTDTAEQPVGAVSTTTGYVYQPRPARHRIPNGRLALRIRNAPWGSGHRTTWKDGKAQHVESCLDSFVRGIEEMGLVLREERLERDRVERERQEQERRRAEEEDRRKHEAALTYDLDSRIDAWQRAGQIREFLVAVTKQHPEPDADLAQWLTWARNRAASLEAGAINTVLQLRQPPERTQWTSRF